MNKTTTLISQQGLESNFQTNIWELPVPSLKHNSGFQHNHKTQ